jgi:hypothetical protein
MIIFDVEIKKGILGRNEVPLEGIEYCGGWRDFENMGVACVCTFDTESHLSRVFTSRRGLTSAKNTSPHSPRAA